MAGLKPWEQAAQAQRMKPWEQYGGATAEQKPDGVIDTLSEGVKSTGRAIGATADTYLGNAQGVVDKAAIQSEAPKDARLESFYSDVERNTTKSIEETGEDPGLLDAIGNVGRAAWDNPAGAGLAVVEQLPNAAPTLAGGWAGMKGGAWAGGAIGSAVAPGLGTAVGGAIGGIAGGLAGMFVGNTLTETGHKAMSAAGDGEFTPEEMSQVKEEGAIKGAVLTGVDAATLGLGRVASGFLTRTTTNAVEAATRKALVDSGVNIADRAAVQAAKETPDIFAKVQAAQKEAVRATDTLKRRAAEAGTLLGMETAGEGLGEYLGELAATGEANVTDAVLESLLGAGQSSVEAAWNMSQSRKPNTDAGFDPRIQPMPSAENPRPAPVNRPDPSAGALSEAANLLPPPAPRPGLPAPDTQYIDSNGEASPIGPNINVDGVLTRASQHSQWVNPQNNPLANGGPGMDRATERGEQAPLVGTLISGNGAGLKSDELGLREGETFDGEVIRSNRLSDERESVFNVDASGQASAGQRSSRSGDYVQGGRGMDQQAPAGSPVEARSPETAQDSNGNVRPVIRLLPDLRENGIAVNAEGHAEPAKLPTRSGDYVQGGTGMEQQSPRDSRFVSVVQANSAVKKLDAPEQFEVVKAGPKDFAVQLKQEARPILQNRDRSTAASITQMRSIASKPDYNRISIGRDFASGAPVVEDGVTVPVAQLGRKDVAVTAAGRLIPIQFAAVEAEDLLPSHDVNGSQVSGYVEGVAGKSRAIAGNGRIAGLTQAYRQGTAAQYRSDMFRDDQHGIDKTALQGMKNPVLVRIMPSEFITQNIGDESNTVGVAALSGSEQAVNDARRLDVSALKFNEAGEIDAAIVRQFVQAMPASERNGLLDGSMPSRQAYARAEEAIFAAAYESDELIRLNSQSSAPESRTVLHGLLNAAPQMIKLKGLGDWDIRGIVVEAAEASVNARRLGQTLQTYASQVDLNRSADADYFIKMFAENIRSAKRIGESLSNTAQVFYDAANATADMYGFINQPSRQELLNGEANGAAENESASAGTAIEQAGAGVAAPVGETRTTEPSERGSAETDQESVQQQGFQLENYTEAELSQREAEQSNAKADESAKAKAAADKAEADAEVSDFALTGSDRSADVAAASGQNDIFTPPTPTVTPVEAFIRAPDGSLDFGEVTADMARAAGRQGGKIRLQQGDETFGLAHIELRHGAEIRGAGFVGVTDFVADIARNIDEIWKPSATRQLVALHSVGKDRVMFVELQPGRDDGGDFYTVKTAFPARPGYTNKAKWKLLWEARAQASGDSGNRPSFAEPSQSAGEKATIPSSQSVNSIARPQQIEDAGEKLGGARKDQLRTVRERLDAMDDEAIASSTLSQLWPKGEIDRIEDPFHAALYHVVRGHIPNKPRAAYRLKAWVSKVKTAREMLASLSDLGADATVLKMREFSPGLNMLADHVEVLMALDRAQWSRVESVRIQLGRYNKDGEMVPGSWVSVDIDGRGVSFYGHDSIVSALPAIKARVEDKPAPEKKMKFAIYSRKSDGRVFISKDGDSEHRSLKEFSDLKSARAFLADHHDQLVSAWEAVKNRDNVTKADLRRSKNAPRAGQDYRHGKDVTTEQFIEAFGFRGVEFGNWVKQGSGGRDRQGMLNEAYDAFMDLAGILNVPTKALSLEGKLGIGFGSRGSGKASAHFEPATVVINLTKTKGAGSLAHEWFHALDNYFARRRAEQAGSVIKGRETAYITYRPEAMYVNKKSSHVRMTRAEIQRYQKSHPSAALYKDENWELDPAHPKGVRPEVEKAFAELVATLNESPMRQRSQVIDGKASDGYWSRIIERGARSFETYVIARLADRGYRNDYLANVQSLESFVRSADRYPYLTSDEQGPVNEAFDKLFNTLETKETDSGVALFSRANRPRGATPVIAHDAIKAIAERLNTRLGLGSELIVYRSEAELFTAVPEIQRQAEQDGASSQIRAVYYKGNIHLVTSKFARESDVELAILDALAHEGQGHYGLRALHGDDLRAVDATLRELFAAIGGVIGIKRLANKHGFNMDLYLETAKTMPAKKAQGYLADELLAHLQGKAATAGLSARVKAAIQAYIGQFRQWLRDRGFTRLAKWDDAELAFLLKRMREASTFKSKAAYADSQSSQFMRAAGDAKSAAFKKWFADSKAVDKDGKPLTLHHGTASEFYIFEQDRAGTSTGHASAGLGVFMTTDRDSAQNYAEKASDGMPGLALVMDLHASIQNPYRMSIEESQEIETLVQSRRVRARLEQQGYDGIQIKGTPVWIAFNNYQVKSATDNVGTYDTIDPDIRFSRKSKSEREALDALGLGSAESESLLSKLRNLTAGESKEWFGDVGARAVEGLFDGLIGIKRAEEAVGVTEADKQGYVSARLATGIADVMNAVMKFGAPEWRDGIVSYREGTRGLLEILSDLGPNNLNNWLGWLGAKRGQLLKQQGLENNLTDKEIAELLALGNGQETLFESVYQEYAKINEAVLDLAQGAGLVDQKERAKWMTDYYVPFYRELEGENQFAGPRTKRGLSHQTAAIRALKGGDAPTADLLTNILQGWAKRIDAAMKNKALLEVVDNLSGSEFLTDESMRFQQVLISRSQIAAKIRQDRKSLKLAAKMLGMKETASQLKVISELMKPENDGFEKMWTQVAPTDPDIIRIQRDGKNEYYRVNDQSLLRGIKAMAGTVFTDPVTTLGRKAKQILTTGVTSSPDFILRNFIRDGAHAWVINPDGFKLVHDSAKGIHRAFKEDEHYRAMMFSGSSFQGGYIHGGDPEAASAMVRRALRQHGMSRKDVDGYMNSLINTPAKAKEMLGTAWEKYRGVSDKVENANRLATYRRAIEAGKSPRQAAYEAKDLMDFSMRGNFIAAQWFTDVVPFLNARMQGLYKLARASKGDKTLLAKHVAMKGMYLALFSLALAGLNDDDERYKELPDWDKDMNWHFWFSADQVQPFRIPKPFELGLIFGTIPERMLHAMSGTQDGGDFAKAISRGVFETLGFNPVPQLVHPLREIQANRNFFRDSPIEDMSDEGKLPEARYDERTSALGRAVGDITGQTIGLSPKQVDHLVQGYLGTMGGYVLSMSNLIAGSASGAARPDATTADVPLLKVLYAGDAVRSNKYQSQFYDLLSEVDQIHRTVKAYREDGQISLAADLLASNSAKLRHRPALGLARQQLGAIRKQRDAIYRNTEMDGATKRQRIDELQLRANAIAGRVVRIAGDDF